MIQRILADSRAYPRVFAWNDPLPRERIRKWADDFGVRLPDDLVDLWSTTGGGDLFETETIVAPFGDVYLGEDLEAENLRLWASGMSRAYLAFHCGLGVSAVRQSDLALVCLDSKLGSELREYHSLDDWYAAELRAEYAERYGMAPQ